MDLRRVAVLAFVASCGSSDPPPLSAADRIYDACDGVRVGMAWDA